MNNREPFFSIIVPVYNAVTRLDVMVQGLLSQACQDFEVILVNDKSTDDSLKLLKQIVKKRANFHLIELEKNQGAGPARNSGVNVAKGKYLFFHDADDWLTEKCLEVLKEHIVQKNHPDLTIFQYATYDQNKKLIKKGKRSLDSLPDEMDGAYVYQAICSSEINPSTWNKVFKKSTWQANELRFLSNSWYEDLAFIPFACLKMHRVTYCRNAFYCYYLDEGGITYEVSDRQVASPSETLNSLRECLETLPYYETLYQDFIRLALHTFHHNFFYLNRNRNFSDNQIIAYIDYFFEFCKAQKIGPVHLMNNHKAMLLIEGFLLERRLRNLAWKSSFALSIDEIEELFEHNMVISRQLELVANNSGNLEELQNTWLKKENALKRKIDRLKEKNQQLNRNFFVRLSKFFSKKKSD